MEKKLNAKIKIPVYKPLLNGNEKKYVNECIDSTWISSKGIFLNKFEESFSKYVGVNYSTGVCNGTIALHLALLALGIGPGDDVIVPTFTYIASVNSILYTGANPIFVDSDLNSWQLDPIDIEKKITPNTKAIMVVHLYGQTADMDTINRIAKIHNLYIIEDCAEAFGSKYKGKHVGTFGDIATFSFFGNKTITTGEGGMVVTNNFSIYERALHLKGQGLAKFREYWHDIVGYNFRMTNIQAALGLAQLEQADVFLEKKRRIADFYKLALRNLPLDFNNEMNETVHSYWMVCILTKNNDTRDKLREFLLANGVETRPTFYPVHLMPMFAQKYTRCSNAESISLRGINLPSYPDLTNEELEFVVELIKKFYNVNYQ